jgi:hypothetical protein
MRTKVHVAARLGQVVDPLKLMRPFATILGLCHFVCYFQRHLRTLYSGPLRSQAAVAAHLVLRHLLPRPPVFPVLMVESIAVPLGSYWQLTKAQCKNMAMFCLRSKKKSNFQIVEKI